MAYIDKTKLINWCNETYKAQTTVVGKGYVNAFLQAIVMSETADVVPRSEVIDEFVERLHKEKIIIKDHRGQLGEVVRIGFIDRIAKEMKENEKFKAELDQAKQEVAREMFAEIERFLFDDKTLINITKFAELKKKFIGE